MKRCIEEHHVPGFGVIPEGSLWDDDSPYIQKSEHFADVFDDKPLRPARKAVARTVEATSAPTTEES